MAWCFRFLTCFFFLDKVLYAYPLDELTSTKNSKAPDRLKQEITDPVHFFQTGVCNGMELLVAARQRTVSTSFVGFKPERHVDSDGSLTTPTSSSSSHHHHHIRLRTISQRHLFRHHGSRSSWFSTYKVMNECRRIISQRWHHHWPHHSF